MRLVNIIIVANIRHNTKIRMSRRHKAHRKCLHSELYIGEQGNTLYGSPYKYNHLKDVHRVIYFSYNPIKVHVCITI